MHEEFVSDFFAQTEEQDVTSLVETEEIIRKLIKEYRISGEIRGDSKCKIKWYYRILDFFSFFRKQ